MSKEQEPAPKRGGIIQRLLKRHVIQTAAIYVAVAWGAVEILLTLTQTLGWPDWINMAALAIFVAGFPVVIILSWYRVLQSKTARSLLVVVAIAMGVSAFWRVGKSSAPESAENSPYHTQTIATVAVISFENLTGDESQQYIANGFTDDIISRLRKHPDLAAIQNESANSPLLASLMPAAQAGRLRADYFVPGGLKTAWAADPSDRNFAINLIGGLAIQVDDFDFAFEVLNSLVQGDQVAGMSLGHSGLWDPKPANRRFRADPRFAELMERISIADYWREIGWSDYCEPAEHVFSCS